MNTVVTNPIVVPMTRNTGIPFQTFTESFPLNQKLVSQYDNSMNKKHEEKKFVKKYSAKVG